LAKKSAWIVVLAAVVAAGAAGCSGRSGSLFGKSGESGAGYGEEGLASQPSIDQFEETGVVSGGGAYVDVHFAFDSDRVDMDAQSAIQQNAAILQADPSRRVEIEGHTDDRGSSEYNLALGARRARAVRDALVSQGVSSDRMSTVSYGEELPLCREATESCWAQNRRVHIVDLTQ